jgi:dipeptidyl aminopeptidase/acylaminoacyl peptidase
MRRVVFLVVLAVFVMASLPNHAAAVTAHTLDFSDLRRLVSLSDAQISPDGTRVAFMESRGDYAKDRRDSQLMLLQIKTRRMRPLTFDRRGVSSPRWSPDGTRIAFLAPVRRDENSEPQDQIFVLRLDGGEAQAVTAAPEGVDNFAWSPDGRRFAYITQDENPREKQIEQHLDAFEVGDNDYLHQAQEMPAHLWTIAASGGQARRLTKGSWSLGTYDPTQISDISWSADGSKIAVTRVPTPLVGDSLASVVEIVDARTGKTARLTHSAGPESSAFFAPAGNAIAYVRNTNGDPTNGNAVYVTRRGSDPIDVRAKIDRNINGDLWAPDGKSLWLFSQDGEHNAVWYVCADGTNVRRVDLGAVSTGGAENTAKNGAVTFVGTTPDHPAELYYLASPDARPQRLTAVNALTRGTQLGRVVAMHWRNDGFAEDGVLTLPPRYDPSRAYPLVLIVHGGPQAASTIGWNSQNQVFAAHGYIIFNPNYRGSTNLGDRYQHAISRDAGAGPGRDVMAGIAAVERAYKIDRSRIAVTGWSYGGYMTSWLTGHYHIWKAAVAGAALNDWFDDYNVAFYVHTDEPYFGGSPWDPKFTSMWRAQSPITYARDISTPTLIMGDIGDNNVTITNSFKMYHALKDNGVPVQFVAYPVHGHFPSDPVRSEDVQKRWLAWVDRYLK